MSRYLVGIKVPSPFQERICALQDEVSAITGLPPPHKKIGPHFTLHRPVTTIKEDVLARLIWSAVLQMRQTRLTLFAWDHFGPKFMVLPAQVPLEASGLFVGISKLLSCLPEYEHNVYDRDNVLHLTIANDTTHVFERAWPKVSGIPIEKMDIPVTEVALLRKEDKKGTRWEEITTFPIPA